MVRDRLIILKPGFEDPAYPGQRFYCWHCMLMEGLLAAFPALEQQLDVERIAWPRPRAEIIAHIGPDNQSLPVLILADDAPMALETDQWRGRRFVAGKDAILKTLAVRYGIPDPHP
jgi:hypothetical protein